MKADLRPLRPGERIPDPFGHRLVAAIRRLFNL